ncbi:MAG: fused MFS/spermidine synthase [Verrucomicrobia bacterium]|nr:fused MFS/spermidine synthase [Verrucomicrobiota bacterium]
MESDESSRCQRGKAWLLLLFVGSGCAALIYEIVWFQLLQLVIGLTNVSLGLLLGIFMGGMCLGSLFLPRLISPKRHPLRVYALLELGIAVIGVAILFLLPWVSDLYTAHAGRGYSGMLWRGVLAALCLLPPTLLMGATLPAIARWVETTREGVSWLGFFYGGNIAGAVVGCLLAGFFLLRVYDMATATYVAAAINVLVAVAALLLATKAKPIDPTEMFRSLAVGGAGERVPTVSDGGTTITMKGWPVYVTIALSGMSALGAEVVWTRLLSLLLGGTVYTFSIILAVFLAGLGLGSSTGSVLARSLKRPRLALASCQLLLLLGITWAALMIARSLPHWPINPALALSPWFTFQIDLARTLWVVLPAAILWGASFPLALAALASRAQDSGRLVGGVYAANTVGAILGALAFSLFIVPVFGTQMAQRALLGISAVATLLLLAVPLWYRNNRGEASRKSHFKFGWAVALIAIAGLAALLIGSVGPVPPGMVAYGRFVATYGDRIAPNIVPEKDVPTSGAHPDIFCTYVGEGLNGTIAVTKWTSGIRNFHSAGKVQASSDLHDMRLQRMLGHLSALAHEKPESVLVVACGAGVTAGSFVTHPEIKRIVICDIEPLVPKFVAPMFAKENFNVINDPRTEVVSDDGRHFIRTTPEKFDVITSDPIDPWVKGCAALNTVEYYEMCKARLKPGGVMSLWIPLYESNAVTVKSIIATFFKVFPNGVVWSNDDDNGEGYDAVLFGQAGPTTFDLDRLQARLDRPDHARVKRSLADVGFVSAVDLLATYAGQATELGEWTRDAQLNTDRSLRLQYLAGWSVNSYLSSEILKGILRYRTYPENLFTGSEPLRGKLKSRLRKISAAENATISNKAVVRADAP